MRKRSWVRGEAERETRARLLASGMTLSTQSCLSFFFFFFFFERGEGGGVNKSETFSFLPLSFCAVEKKKKTRGGKKLFFCNSPRAPASSPPSGPCTPSTSGRGSPRFRTARCRRCMRGRRRKKKENQSWTLLLLPPRRHLPPPPSLSRRRRLFLPRGRARGRRQSAPRGCTRSAPPLSGSERGRARRGGGPPSRPRGASPTRRGRGGGA